jgi:hypothetical protein
MAISGSNEYRAFADSRGKSNIRRFVTDHPGKSQIDVEILRGLKDQMWQGFSAHAFVIWCMWADVEVLDLNMLKIKKLEKSLVDLIKDVRGEVSSADPRLICDDDQQVSGIGKP